MKKLLALLFTFAIYQAVSAQNKIIGCWEAIEVTMGNQTMTPVGKWTKIHPNNTFESGNGWIQNSTGKWTFKNDSITMTDTLNVEDPYGGFILSWSGDTMIWQRDEDGERIAVKWRPITQIPMTPLDYIYGNWEMTEPASDSFLSYPTTLYFRWDRIYKTSSTHTGSPTGYWQVHGHRNRITFIPHDTKQSFVHYTFSLPHSDTLILQSQSDTLSTLVFFRQRKQ